MTSLFPVPLSGTANTLMWAHEPDIEPQAAAQLHNIAALPWTHAVRVMPDVHHGKGATVGSVIAMRNAVSPSAVGVDIGCGVVAVKTSLTVNDLPDDLSVLRARIEAAVPVGFSSHNVAAPIEKIPGGAGLAARRDAHLMGFHDLRAPLDEAWNENAFKRSLAQCGTLGGGNHFIELCSDDDGLLWLTLHSGSRNIGKVLAEYHIEQAKGLDHNLGLPDRDLAVFLSDTAGMSNYLHDLEWAQKYAMLNRETMMVLVKNVVRTLLPGVMFDAGINCHHNYVSYEQYDGVDVIVTRKGAIRAGLGDMALIPGSMGTGSYVVRGKGNALSLNSASHGAGRKLSRTAAKKRFSVEDLVAQTAGIECRKDAGVVDEIPAAYKNIETVIEAQVDLVDVVARLTTLLCVKG